MGETAPPQQIEITFAPGAGEALAQVIVSTIEAYASARITPPTADAVREAYEAGYANGKQDGTDRPNAEPWRFHSPSAQCDVVAYLDDHNQVRHVPVTRTTDVPKHWRRVYVDRTDA